MVVKIFLKGDCPNCPNAKELGEKLKGKGHSVNFLDVKDDQGISQAIHHDINQVPSIVISNDENETLKSWQGSTPHVVEVLKHL